MTILSDEIRSLIKRNNFRIIINIFDKIVNVDQWDGIKWKPIYIIPLIYGDILEQKQITDNVLTILGRKYV